MPHSFFLSYAREDATIGEPSQPDPHFAAFLERLELRVKQLTGYSGFVDRNILTGQEWPDKLAEALRTAHTMVCLYSPAYFQSEFCGKEMQVFLDRRQNYIRANGGMKPANIIPVLWQPVPWRIPKTLPDIQYKDVNLDDSGTKGIWDLGDQGQTRELMNVADQIARRVRDAADLTPLAPLRQCPRMEAVSSAFLPPPLPLPEFDSRDARKGPDTVTFVYASSTNWKEWPWAPPPEQAVLYLAAAVAKGRELQSTQLTFDLADDAKLARRLATLRCSNNIVILFVDAAGLGHEGLRARIRDYDRPEHSSFATIILMNNSCSAELRARIDGLFPYFARLVHPHFQIVEPHEGFNSRMRESFSKAVAETLEQLRLAVINDPHAPNVIGNATDFQSLPAVNGPGRIA
jgi:hypothetical protein